MAVRSGTNLKVDLAAIVTALSTAVTTPTAANLAALVVACDTVVINGRDSRAVTLTAGSETGVGASFAGLARDLRRDVQILIKNGHGETAFVSAASTTKELKRIQKSVADADSPWQGFTLGALTT